MTYKTAVLTIAGLLMAGCLGGASAPVASQAPVTAVPVGRVESSALPPPTGAAASAATAAPRDTRRSPSSASVTNVSRVSTGAPTGGNALGGTIVSGQTAGAIPTTIDRNREPVRVRSTAPRDPLGPGTAPAATS